MKTTTNIGVVALTLFTASAGSSLAQDLSLNFSSLQNSEIVFGGSADDFTFLNSTPLVNLGTGSEGPAGYAQWDITSESGGAATGTAIGFKGNLDNGPFSYSPITVLGPLQTATVIGPLGQLDIADNSGGVLQGTVNFIDVSTYGQIGGFLNANVNVNLVNVTYVGSNPDLQFLNANQPGSVDLSFQFDPGMNLQELSSGNGGYGTSYSGSISVVAIPEPASLMMSALGGLGAVGVGFRRFKKS